MADGALITELIASVIDATSRAKVRTWTATERLFNTLEDDNWEDLKGTYVRASFEHNTMKSIGHLIKDKWFDYEEYYQMVEAIAASRAE